MLNDRTPYRNAPEAGTPQAPWQTPELRHVGDIADVIQQGGGKITTTTGDPGEPRKVAPTG